VSAAPWREAPPLVPSAPLPVPPAPRSLPGFEHVNRYYDKQRGRWAAKILPGEYYVTTGGELITTVLGSCVSACIRDPNTRVGGMNHFMLPEKGEGAGFATGGVNDAFRYGTFAMEHMINDILKQGARRQSLEVKITGGGRVLAQMTNIGLKNIAFVREYLRTEGLAVTAEDVGDVHPRKVLYEPATGRLLVKKLRTLHNDTIIRRETAYRHTLEKQPVGGEVELF
jgi:chemotaxis protein CheD